MSVCDGPMVPLAAVVRMLLNRPVQYIVVEAISACEQGQQWRGEWQPLREMPGKATSAAISACESELQGSGAMQDVGPSAVGQCIDQRVQGSVRSDEGRLRPVIAKGHAGRE